MLFDRVEKFRTCSFVLGNVKCFYVKEEFPLLIVAFHLLADAKKYKRVLNRFARSTIETENDTGEHKLILNFND